MISRLIRGVLWLLLSLIAALIVGIVLLIIPVDRNPYKERESYRQTREAIEALEIPTVQKSPVSAGYAVENITPEFPVSMAGSGLRKLRAEGINDSLMVRTLVLANDTDTVAIVSVDMLIFPPALRRLLRERLPTVGLTIDQTFLGATHTHSGIGNWGEHLAGRLYSGPYDQKMMDRLASKVTKCIVNARKDLQAATLRKGGIPVPELVYNRLWEDGKVDSLLRVIEITRQDSSRLLFASFTGHATCDRSDSKMISRDYPGVFVDAIEQRDYDFAMFVAGAVGSHSCRGPNSGQEKISFVGESLAEAFLSNRDVLEPLDDSLIVMVNAPLALPEPQFRISDDWRIRPWLFHAVFGSYSSQLKLLRIGDVVMIGTPCDFSGELALQIDDVASSLGVDAMVTSFNGSYIGYITVDERYDDSHYETRLMNWYGPWNGAYLVDAISGLLEKIAEPD